MSIFPTRVLLATDGSNDARLAAEAAADLAAKTGTELQVLAVGRTFPTAVYASYVDQAEDELRREAQEVLDNEVRQIEDAGGEITQSYLRMGEERDEAIVHLAEEIDAGVIVVGSRGRGRVRRALMGSVSDSVVRHAHCPVMVVRNQNT